MRRFACTQSAARLAPRASLAHGTSATLATSFSRSAAPVCMPLRRRLATDKDSGGSKYYAGLAAAILGAAAITGYAVLQMGDKPTHAPVALNQDEFRAFEVIEVADVTPNTRRIRFALPSKNHVLGLPVASCIVTRANIGENGKPVIRPYTPVTNDKKDKGHFDLVVKTYPTGVMSKHIYNLKIGDKLEVKGPISKLPYTKNMKKHIGMLAGGTGITPMLQVLEEILSERDDKTQVTLLFGNDSEDQIIIKDRLDNLAKRHPNFKVHYVVTKPNTDSWKGYTGFINGELIKRHIPGPSDDVLVMVCGPPPFYEALSGNKAKDYSQGELSGALKDLGYTKEQVFKF